MVKDKAEQTKPKEKYGLSNWSDYNNALQKRVSLTIWLDDSVPGNWLYSGAQIQQ